MPSLIGHVAVPLVVGLSLGPRLIPRPVLWSGVLLSVLPDLDVLAFALGIPYTSAFGHRGFSHSLLFAAVLALLFSLGLRAARGRHLRSFLFLFLAGASHGLLDALTDGGLGIALLWPFSDARYFAPIRVIDVSPIGLRRFLSPRGLAVLQSELLWIWLPLSLAGLALFLLRRKKLLWAR